MAVWECRDCRKTLKFPRGYALHFGPHCICPRCATTRVSRRSKPDPIDGKQGGLLNLLERLAGGRLYHCRYCRVQFYDRRRMATEVEIAREEAPVTSPPDTATSDE